MKESTCYLCKGKNVNDFFHLPPVPTQDGVMCNTEEEAFSVNKGSITLRYCSDCGYVGNEDHDISKVSFDEYDFANDNSPIYASFIRDLSDRLISQYELREKTILDIGCGRGDFLKVICQRGNNKGIGIDPGFDFSTITNGSTDKISFIRDYYSPDYHHLKADLITSRLVISIPSDPVSLIKTIRDHLDDSPDSIVYFDIPNIEYTLGEKIIWNVVYEARSWYCKASLTYLLELCGFEVLDVRLCWNDEYLSIEARPDPLRRKPSLPSPDKLATLSAAVNSFGSEFDSLIKNYTEKINEITSSGKKTLAWGAGARGLSFFNQFDLIKEIPFIIDINTNRQGKYLPGSGQKIVSPDFAQSYQPDLIIITNPTYSDEIITHAKQLGLDSEFWIL